MLILALFYAGVSRLLSVLYNDPYKTIVIVYYNPMSQAAEKRQQLAGQGALLLTAVL